MQRPINILRAQQAGDYRLHLAFDDGTEQTVDFLPFLSRSHHPDIRAFLDRKRFADFRIEEGDLIWGDFDLCFPIMDLYHNRILYAGSMSRLLEGGGIGGRSGRQSNP